MNKIIMFLLGIMVIGSTIAENSIETVPMYNSSEWMKVNQQGAVSVIEFNASWCSTCRNQHKSLEIIAKDQKYKDVKFFKADYDQEEELKEKYDVSSQSTLIVFKGNKEISRVVGETSVEKLSELINKAL